MAITGVEGNIKYTATCLERERQEEALLAAQVLTTHYHYYYCGYGYPLPPRVGVTIWWQVPPHRIFHLAGLLRYRMPERGGNSPVSGQKAFWRARNRYPRHHPKSKQPPHRGEIQDAPNPSSHPAEARDTSLHN